jgi:hypothetical protein
MRLGVTRGAALGVIARFPNPADPAGMLLGVWGCRAEATHTTARYLHHNFDELKRQVPESDSWVVLLAIRGVRQDEAHVMYIGDQSRTLQIDETRLEPYLAAGHDRAAETTS